MGGASHGPNYVLAVHVDALFLETWISHLLHNARYATMQLQFHGFVVFAHAVADKQRLFACSCCLSPAAQYGNML